MAESLKRCGGSTGLVSPDDFVIVWQTANHIEDVAETLEQSVLTVSVRATRYRQHGVPLRRLASRSRSETSNIGGCKEQVDWPALAELARELAVRRNQHTES